MDKITYIYNRGEYIPQIIDYINKEATLLNPDTNETFKIELRELGIESEATKRICDKGEELQQEIVTKKIELKKNIAICEELHSFSGYVETVLEEEYKKANRCILMLKNEIYQLKKDRELVLSLYGREVL